MIGRTSAPVRIIVCYLAAASLLIVIGLTVANFPTHVDPPAPPSLDRNRAFYERIYEPTGLVDELDYVKTAQELTSHNVRRRMQRFVREYRLEHSRVLEVGSGSGTLQDVVWDYTGLDIAGAVRRFYHKPFVQGSATALPFKDSEFDVIWTVSTLEHVPNPTRALMEMRRVLKAGGLLYLFPGWNVSTWAASEYSVRPYGELSWKEKLTKASLPVRSSYPYKALYKIPIRFVRWLQWHMNGGPTDLRYILLQPSEKFFAADSDALNSIDTYEAYLWFTSRGDACQNCEKILFRASFPLIIKIQKTPSGLKNAEAVSMKRELSHQETQMLGTAPQDKK